MPTLTPDNMSSSNHIDHVIDDLRSVGFAVEADRVRIQIPDAPRVLWAWIQWYLSRRGETFHKVEFTDANGTLHNPYREVADWLTDNHGRGLLLYGSCGLGKTMLARYILPPLIHQSCSKITHCYTMTELNNPSTLDEAMRYKILSIDDVGVEEQMISFGQRRNVFDEIMDSAEKQGKLLIITTNLTGRLIEERYGTRTLDRIQSLCRRVMFQLYDNHGNIQSLRPKL